MKYLLILTIALASISFAGIDEDLNKLKRVLKKGEATADEQAELLIALSQIQVELDSLKIVDNSGAPEVESNDEQNPKKKQKANKRKSGE